MTANGGDVLGQQRCSPLDRGVREGLEEASKIKLFKGTNPSV
jgi:hypothetical protein